ncbi:MAG TPA: DUF4252 domain-containing protein [Prolixibacteraceae bacterium]|nr:DUF4252 domain-containing protein [Prolixibacteraceae bacterium]
MKTITTFLALCFFVTTSLAQSKSDKLYDVFAGKEGVTNFSFSKNMIDAINLDLGDDENERKVTGDLQQVRFLSYNPQKGDLSGPQFHKKALALLPSNYKEYKDLDSGDSNTEIWLLGKRKKYSECHVFLTNQADNQMRFLVSFYGNFHVNDLKELKEAGKSFSDK